MKKIFLKLTISFLTIALLFTNIGCEAKNDEHSTDRESCVIGEKEFFFIDDATKQEWKEPIAKLLSNELVPYGERGDILGYKPTLDPKLPAVPQNYRCGLLDLTNDGIPELLVQPFGSFGSSGIAEYFAYNIYSGQKIGELEDGMGDSWCFYYNTEFDYLELCGEYWHRSGVFWLGYYMYESIYDEQYMQSSTYQRLHAGYELQTMGDPEDGDYIKPTKNAFYDASDVGICKEIDYYINTKSVSEDEYFSECEKKSSVLIKIPETALVLIDWDDVSDDGDDCLQKAEKMAEALVNTKQKFIIP